MELTKYDHIKTQLTKPLSKHVRHLFNCLNMHRMDPQVENSGYEIILHHNLVNKTLVKTHKTPVQLLKHPQHRKTEVISRVHPNPS